MTMPVEAIISLAIEFLVLAYIVIDIFVEYKIKQELKKQNTEVADLVSQMLLDQFSLNDDAFEARKALIRISSKHSR
jgi:hypothetical protein